jgi:hypothetical protein
MLMKTFFSQIFQAFVQSRQLQADRIVQRHGFVPVERGRDFRRPIEMTNVGWRLSHNSSAPDPMRDTA